MQAPYSGSTRVWAPNELHMKLETPRDCIRPWCAPQFAIYPLELIRTRLAVCPEGTYAGLSAAAASIWRTEGALSFYRGLLPSLVSHPPAPRWGPWCS